MKFNIRYLTGIILLLVLLMALSSSVMARQDTTTIRLVTHDSFAVSDEVLTAFEDETGIRVEILYSGDAGAMVNQAVLSKNNPLGDVLFGVDNTFLGRALEADIFTPYESPLLENVPAEFVLDGENRVTPVDYGDVCLNYEIAYFEENGLPIPESLADLTTETYKGLLVVENPAVSSPGLAFLLATVAEFGTDGDYTYLDFWAALKKNDMLVVDNWTQAYFSAFTVAGGGDRPLVVSYASSPPAEVLFADPPVDEAPTGSIVADGMCYRQIEFAGILRGTKHEAEAQQFIDFLLSTIFQEDIPLQMFVFPVNDQAEPPGVFTDYASIPENPANLSFEDINAHRSEWIEAWTETVLH